MQAVFRPAHIPLILTSLSLHLTISHGSPLSPSNSSCPSGWVQYDHYCVTSGQGSSDRAVALYCDGFGGIGIKGLCIIRAPKVEQPSAIEDPEDSNESPAAEPLFQSSRIFPSLHTSALESDLSEADAYVYSNQDLQEALRDSSGTPDQLCALGWSHFRNLCVYKYLKPAATCRLMNGVDIHGLCVKHARLEEKSTRTLLAAKHKAKRICCCAKFGAKANNYAC